MKKISVGLLILLFLLSCDLSTSLGPTEESSDMSATVNSIMTTFPTIDSLPTKKPTSQATLLAPIPLLQTPGSGTTFPTLDQSAPQTTLTVMSASSQTTGISQTITVTPTITPTFMPEDPRSMLGPPSWNDNYANGNNWPQGNDQFTSVIFSDGFMKLTALTDTDGWRLTYPNLKNFYLEANFQTGDCKTTDHFGIIFRVPDISLANQGYFYGIQCDGKYFLKVFAENLMTSIVYAKTSSAILPGKDVVNRLGIMAEDDQLSLFVNGTLVKEVSDTHFERGGFGIFIGSDAVKNLTVWVDEINYWSLP